MNTAPNLSALQVARHKYPQPPLLDGACLGLRLVALKPTGDRKDRSSWIYRYRTRDKRLRQIKLGEYPTLGLADARKAWGHQKAIRDDLARGDPRLALQHDNAAKKAAHEEARKQRYTVKLLCEDSSVPTLFEQDQLFIGNVLDVGCHGLRK